MLMIVPFKDYLNRNSLTSLLRMYSLFLRETWAYVHQQISTYLSKSSPSPDYLIITCLTSLFMFLAFDLHHAETSIGKLDCIISINRMGILRCASMLSVLIICLIYKNMSTVLTNFKPKKKKSI